MISQLHTWLTTISIGPFSTSNHTTITILSILEYCLALGTLLLNTKITLKTKTLWMLLNLGFPVSSSKSKMTRMWPSGALFWGLSLIGWSWLSIKLSIGTPRNGHLVGVWFTWSLQGPFTRLELDWSQCLWFWTINSSYLCKSWWRILTGRHLLGWPTAYSFATRSSWSLGSLTLSKVFGLTNLTPTFTSFLS